MAPSGFSADERHMSVVSCGGATPAEPAREGAREAGNACDRNTSTGKRFPVADAPAPDAEKRRQIRRNQQVNLISWIGQAEGHIVPRQNQPERDRGSAVKVELRDNTLFRQLIALGAVAQPPH